MAGRSGCAVRTFHRTLAGWREQNVPVPDIPGLFCTLFPEFAEPRAGNDHRPAAAWFEECTVIMDHCMIMPCLLCMELAEFGWG